MPDPCELLSKCGFFLNFKGNSEVVKNGWINTYCKDQQRSNNCKRKQHRKNTGSPPADNMTPTGRML